MLNQIVTYSLVLVPSFALTRFLYFKLARNWTTMRNQILISAYGDKFWFQPTVTTFQKF